MYESAIDERRIIFVLYEFITINVRRNKKMWEKNKDFKSITDVVQYILLFRETYADSDSS